ncbi:sirohydrochlorin chelatase [Halobacterium jilantaiense]|uniref:Sirohydrochlorin ferrochelatase n=1 Tax=Halobacterium jilantaiense TaxID=355548 RepID=A0A1I0QMD1_9EURY|nr:sirohydrochlorin chelatase [Halobacterium jilantaiense]SEW28442.1 Sirohydrochlorin ferrochelatase [Halobacterium jilantaiense]
MTRDALVLLGRDTPHARETLATHARRLRDRGVADAVHACHYEHEPRRDLRDPLARVDADRAFAVPMTAAHARETTVDVPAALARVDAAVHYCEPVCRSGAVTDALHDRATEAAAGDPAAVGLVALGASSQPYHRQVAEYHAARLRERGDYEDVSTAFLVQNPAAECLRYNLDADDAVAVPLFVAGSDATDRDIPDRLELDRGGLAYADVLGTHPRLTDAVAGLVAEKRVLAEREDAESVDDSLTADATAFAADGEGR